MRNILKTTIKMVLFFLGWALCVGLISTVPSAIPAVWRFWAELIPLAAIIAISAIFWVIEKRRFPIMTLHKPLKNIILGFATGLVWLGLTTGILVLIGSLKFEVNDHVQLLGVWISACLLNVIMQELLVRGYLYQLLKHEHHVIAAAVVTTALFTLLHGGAFEAGVIAVLNVITMSLFITAVLEYTESLIAPIIIHFTWNTIGAIFLGGVSLADDYPHLLNTTFSGNELISGGNYKMEGSIIVLILNIGLFMLFYIMNKRKARSDSTLYRGVK